MLVRASDGGGTIQTTVQARITNQVLTVIAPNGAMSSRYRQDMVSTNMDDPFGEGGGDP